MIAVTIFTEPTSDTTCEFLEDSMRIENISSEDFLEKEDWDILEECIMNLDTDNYKADEWYQVTFKRNYSDDGSGQLSVLWFDFIEKIIVTQN